MAAMLAVAALGLILPATATGEVGGPTSPRPVPCLAPDQGVAMTLRDRDGVDRTYRYFRLGGTDWVVVRYQRGQDRPEHVWFGTVAPDNPGVVRVDRDEALDAAGHRDPARAGRTADRTRAPGAPWPDGILRRSADRDVERQLDSHPAPAADVVARTSPARRRLPPGDQGHRRAVPDGGDRGARVAGPDHGQRARAGGVPLADGLGPDRQYPAHPPRSRRPLHVVGLSGRARSTAAGACGSTTSS